MLCATRSRMAGTKGGRPPKNAGDGSTHPVRVFTDTAQKAIDLSDLYGLSTANILDPMIRDMVEEKWEKNKAAIEKMKALDKEKERVRQQAGKKKPQD